jgi:signal transduction histidine kinase
VKPCTPALIDAAHSQREWVETVICATIPRSAWRADHRIRAGDTNRSGAGLGLSIVKTIAQSHAASVDLSESKLGGLGVTVSFELG